MELITKRLKLKPTTGKDFDILFEMLTDTYVRKYLCDNEIYSKEKIAGFHTMSMDSFTSKLYGLWLIENNELGKVIGFAGLWYFFEETQPQLLYALLPQYTGQGFATEAALAITQYSFQKLGFNYLIASCDTPNESSHQVARRLGMVQFKEEKINEKPVTFYRIEKPFAYKIQL